MSFHCVCDSIYILFQSIELYGCRKSWYHRTVVFHRVKGMQCIYYYCSIQDAILRLTSLGIAWLFGKCFWPRFTSTRLSAGPPSVFLNTILYSLSVLIVQVVTLSERVCFRSFLKNRIVSQLALYFFSMHCTELVHFHAADSFPCLLLAGLLMPQMLHILY